MSAPSEPTAPWASAEDASKKELVAWLQENGNNAFLLRHRIRGKVASVAKGAKKPALVKAFDDLFATKDFRTEADDKEAEELAAKLAAAKLAEKEKKAEAAAEGASAAVAEKKLFKKVTLKKGDKLNFPKNGDQVKVRYKGMLTDGTVFDENFSTKGKKKRPALQFRVGAGQVIKGWEEAMKEMSIGERAKITIEPAWAYGAAGKPAAGIPADATLVFEVSLESIL